MRFMHGRAQGCTEMHGGVHRGVQLEMMKAKFKASNSVYLPKLLALNLTGFN